MRLNKYKLFKSITASAYKCLHPLGGAKEEQIWETGRKRLQDWPSAREGVVVVLSIPASKCKFSLCIPGEIW